MSEYASAVGILVAALDGAAIGVERERSGHAAGRHARFGGIRTFTLLGGAAGVAGWLSALGYTGLGIALTAGALLLVVAGYVAAGRRDVDATTEIAAVVTVGAGLAAGLGWLALASGVVAVTVLLLIEKSALHAWVRRVGTEELRAGAQFAVMAVVVLPLLPEGPFGPLGGVKPRELWLLVLLFTGLSFLGYIGRRLVSLREGYPLTGLLGGIVSSTSVTLAFARLSRNDRAHAQPLAIGSVAACTMLFPRVMVATAVLNLPLARAVSWYLVAPFALGVLTLALAWRNHQPSADGPAERLTSPLRFWPAVEMAVLFQFVLFAVRVARDHFGDLGLLTSGALLGLTDVDALTLSMAKAADSGEAHRVAAQAIAVGILANCVLKTVAALALGAPKFRRVAGFVIAGMAILIGVSLSLK